VPRDAALLGRARHGDHDAFQQLTEPHRRELQLHCYQMLGSFHDAEDLVQETYLRAWRGVEDFEGRASVRAWLYRIATNACLNALASRASKRRVLPETHGSPSTDMPGKEPANDISWLDPYPDSALDGIADESLGPDARYEMREAVQLAFVAAIQLLPPRQRAALLLRDVLGWSASEAAKLLNGSVASINGALQRARALVQKRLSGGTAHTPRPPTERQRALLERYVHTWERADVEGFVALLRDDVVFTMPPWRQWYRGREAVGKFFAWTARSGGPSPFRLLPTAANGQPAFAFYSRSQGSVWRAHSVQVVEIRDDSVAGMTSFVRPALVEAFGFPPHFNQSPQST